MDLSALKNIYFLGIGGIGMSALARWFQHQGKKVSGYDLTTTPLTNQLEGEGIDIHYEDSIDLIPEAVLQNPDQTLIVYTPAIPKDHQEYNYLKKKNFTIKKRSAVLGDITRGHYAVAVGGTHGKTSTTATIAHILKTSDKNATSFVGGITKNYHSNLLLSSNPKDEIILTEADEFDRSFLQLHPNIAVITSVDADHLDIYGDKSEVVKAYHTFMNQTSSDGLVLLQENALEEMKNQNLPLPAHLASYGLRSGDYHGENIEFYVEEGKIPYFKFDFIYPKGEIRDIKLQSPGFHNVENAIAGIAVSLTLGISEKTIKQALASYKGVRRRFDYQLTEPVVFIDDYAHHPSEISAFLKSVKALYPDKKITAIFQPHLYSRTRDFLDGFAESLSVADELILLPIYPARELPIEGVSSEIIYDKVTTMKFVYPKDKLFKHLAGRPMDVVLTIGAGDIDQLVTPIKEFLERL